MATARTDGLVSSYFSQVTDIKIALQWRNYESLCFSNHRRLDCLFHRLFRRSSKKTSKLRVTGLCEGNPLVAVWFPSQRASNAEMFPFGDVILGYLLLDDICSVVTYTWHGIVLCITCHFSRIPLTKGNTHNNSSIMGCCKGPMRTFDDFFVASWTNFSTYSWDSGE